MFLNRLLKYKRMFIYADFDNFYSFFTDDAMKTRENVA